MTRDWTCSQEKSCTLFLVWLADLETAQARLVWFPLVIISTTTKRLSQKRFSVPSYSLRWQPFQNWKLEIQFANMNLIMLNNPHRGWSHIREPTLHRQKWANSVPKQLPTTWQEVYPIVDENLSRWHWVHSWLTKMSRFYWTDWTTIFNTRWNRFRNVKS